MDRALWVALGGARAVVQQEASQAHNLANVGTTGFRAAIDAFRSVPVAGAGLPTRVHAIDSTVATDFRQGGVRTTGSPLDLAIDGPGFFAVQDGPGREAYTRAGDFQVRPDGTLVDSRGRVVLGEAGPLLIPQDRGIEVAADGTISSLPLTPPLIDSAIVGRIKLVNPDTASLERGADGLFRTPDRQPLAASPVVRVQSGAVEDSNVNPIDSLLASIRNGRAFDLQMRLIQNIAQNAEASSRLLNIFR